VSTAERPVIRVCATSERVELQAQVRMMQSFDEVKPYLQANGLAPTAQELVAVVNHHLIAPDVESSDLLDFPSGVLLDLFRHITPDPPTGPHPDTLALPDKRREGQS